MQRVTEVIDCWYDSGAMPFAQWGWPHQNDQRFATQFPADFISEAIDQTRGWFYSQLAISTMLFGPCPPGVTPAAEIREQSFPHPFRTCIVLGLMLGEDGNKMSKQKRNYREPREIFDRYGADALRWYFFATQPPWTVIRYREQAIRDSIPEFLLRLWNVFSFFTIYAESDSFDPRRGINSPGQLQLDSLRTGDGWRSPAERSEIDRWIFSELHQTIAIVTQRMDAFDNYAAAQAITSLVDGLSNWFVRRSRNRFWAEDKQDVDKLDAYWTLYEVLLEVTKLVAPFVPFLAETLWQQLAVFGFGESSGNAKVNNWVPESVHLCDYPLADERRIDAKLSQNMNLLREIASLGRAARAEAKLKVRQPLKCIEVILADNEPRSWLQSHENLLREELNVGRIEYASDARQYVEYQVTPNFKRLGPKLGSRLPKVKQLLAGADGGDMLTQMQTTGQIVLSIDGDLVSLDQEDIQVRLQAKPGWAAAQGKGCVVVLNTEVTPKLEREGWARDLIRAIQSQRKELGFRFTDRIHVRLATDSVDMRRAVEENRDTVMTETLTTDFGFVENAAGSVHEIGPANISLDIKIDK